MGAAWELHVMCELAFRGTLGATSWAGPLPFSIFVAFEYLFSNCRQGITDEKSFTDYRLFILSSRKLLG
jgi:hypothetical protein